MRIGMNLWTVYGWQLPERASERVLGALASMGLEAVELVLDEGMNSAGELLAHQAEIKAILARHGLAVPAIATALFWRYNLGSQDEGIRRHAICIVKDLCRVAKAYGANAVLTVAGQQEPHTPYMQTWRTAVRSIREAARVAEDLGVLIGVENVPTNFLDTPGEMARFLGDVDHPSVGCYLDPGNGMWVRNGFPENWCTAVCGRIVAVHVKDHDLKQRKNVCCGQGDLPWGDVLPVLRECGYDGYLIVETPADEPGIEAGLEAARQSFEGMKRLLAAG